MTDADELAREEAYIAKITARKNQQFEKKVFGGGLEAARSGSQGSGTPSGKFGGGLEAARAQAGTSGKFGAKTPPPSLEEARAAAGLQHPGMKTYPPVANTPTPTPAPVTHTPPAHSFPPLQSNVVELTMDLTLPAPAPPKQSEPPKVSNTPAHGLSDNDEAAAREEARMNRALGGFQNRGSALGGGTSAPVSAPPANQQLHHHQPTAAYEAPVHSPNYSSSAHQQTVSHQAPVHHSTPATAHHTAPVVPKELPAWEQPPAQAQYGTKFENLVLAEILSARNSPRAVINDLQKRKQHYTGNEYRNPTTNLVMSTMEGVKAVDEAIQFLERLNPLGPNSKLTLEEGLSQSARDFCLIQKSLNAVESDAEANERLVRYGRYHGTLLQNVAFTNVTSDELVLDWIIDDGNAHQGRPHRHAIFNPNVKSIGIASGPHVVGRVACALFSEGYTPAGAGGNRSPAPVQAPISQAPTSSISAKDQYPDFVVGQLEPVDGNKANLLPISHLGCSVSDISVGLRQNGNQVEFKRLVSREGRLFNLPYQVTAQSCTAVYSPNENGGTLRIKLGKPQAHSVGASGEYTICQYTVPGNPSSSTQRVQIQVKQDSSEYYEFVPGPASPFDTTFTVVLADTNLMFKGTFSQPEGQTTKVINSTQTVNLPVSPPKEQIEALDSPSGGKVVRIWHKPRPGQAVSHQLTQPDCDIPIQQY